MSDHHHERQQHVRAFEIHGARIGVRFVGTGTDVADALLAAALPMGAQRIAPERLHQICEHEAGSSHDSEDLASVLDFAVAAHATERVVLHAGVVAWEGLAIVLPGRSLSGKTTLTAALVRAGATFYSDEFAPIDRDGRVWPHARPLRVRAPGSTGPGRPVPVEDLGVRPGTEPVPVGLVIDTRHVAGSTWQPERLDAGAGLLRLLDNAVVAQTAPDLALSFLAPVAASATVLTGPRGDADETAARILMAAGHTGDRVVPSFVALELPPGTGLGSARHQLIRTVLAAQHATALRRAARPGSAGLGLALPALEGSSGASADEPVDAPVPWSSLYDLPRLAAGCGLEVADLDEGVVAGPAVRWDRLELVPPQPGQLTDEVWEPEEAVGDGPRGVSRPSGSTSRLPLGATRRVRASCPPDARALAESLWPEALGGGGVVLAGADQIGWGATYTSRDFWSIVASLRPVGPILDAAAQVRPTGPYLGVHWRRGSYVVMKPRVSPSPAVAAGQIAAIAGAAGLTAVAVATDATAEEIAALRRAAARIDRRLGITVIGEVASDGRPALVQRLVEQVVLAESTWFVGTRGSSTTVAIREERVVRGGWTPEATWSVLCGDAHDRADADDEGHGPIWELPVRR